MPQDTASPVTRPPSARHIKLGIAALLGCLGFFLFDIAEDLFEDAVTAAPLTIWRLLHHALEALSVTALAFAAFVLYRSLQSLRAQTDVQSATISVLRGEVHRAIEARCSDWGLTPAERDVALLILKGCTVAEIAQMRSTAPGTVKAQSTAVFRKAGVASKTELMSLFLDEFTGPDTLAARAAPGPGESPAGH